MIPHTALDNEQTLNLLNVDQADRAETLALVGGETSSGAEVVMDFLSSRLGSSDDSVPALEVDGRLVTELEWLEGMIRFVPAIQHWYAVHDIPNAIAQDSLADFGRNLAINRRVHGRFGMDTYKWLTHTFAGRLFGLGRLQFLIHQPSANIPGVAAGDWILGIHIPENGPLTVKAVTESIASAKPFFDTHFPERPVTVANCESWLLDPYLSEHIDAQSNIARFAALFTPYGAPRDEPTDAVYFTFRTRDMTQLGSLPRATALQRVVLERIDDGGSWQLGFGYLALPR